MVEGGSSFKFNEGMYQMERIHEIQSKMNICKNFCLRKDDATGLYGFQTWYTLLNALYLEFAAKLTTAEEKKVTNMRKELKETLKKVIKNVANQNGRMTQRIVPSGWESAEEGLFEYELELKRLMAKHKISSPEAADPTRAVVN